MNSYVNNHLTAEASHIQAESVGDADNLCPSSYPELPAYMREVYHWAYLEPGNVRLLDSEIVVFAILLGNNNRLRRALIAEISEGQSVLQAAHVYGGLIQEMARKVGVNGGLDVVELVPLQARICRWKLRDYSQACVILGDAANPGQTTYDVISCFFLLHEIPDEKKFAVVDALLTQLKPGGKVVFIDYHRPAAWHPLRVILRYLLRRLEPFAESLWHHEIDEYASAADNYRWQKRTFFGGLYQKVIAVRL